MSKLEESVVYRKAPRPLREPPGPPVGARAAHSRLRVVIDPAAAQGPGVLNLAWPVPATRRPEAFFQRPEPVDDSGLSPGRCYN